MSFVKVSSSILSADFSKLGEEVSFLDSSVTDYIHIDVMDGHFVPNITFGPSFVSAIRPFSKKVFDVHLMLKNPSSFIVPFLKAGADIISIHREISENLEENFKQIRSLNKKSGIVYNPDSSVEDVADWLDFVDQIIIMSVHPGFEGQSFLQKTYEKVLQVKKILKQRNYFHIDIVVDGGVTVQNAPQLVKNGCTVLVSGSSVFKKSSRSEQAFVIQQLKNS